MSKKQLDDEEVYEKAIEKWGKPAQILVFIEEMAELTKALCKHLNNRGDINNIYEEIADVSIMLNQMYEIFDCEEILKYFNFKMERIKKRLMDE